MMIESTRILIRDDYPIQGKVYFRQDDEEGEYGGVPLTELTLTVDDWDEMGRPDIVTVSIKPGDHLNLPGEALASSSEYVEGATEVPPGLPVNLHVHGSECHPNCAVCGGRARG